MKKASKSVLRLPLEKRAEIAFKEAVEEVIDEHARLRLPLHIWRDGKVVALSLDEVLELSPSSGGPCSFRERAPRNLEQFVCGDSRSPIPDPRFKLRGG